MIEDKKLGCRLVGKRFSELLNDPGTGRMACDVEVQDAPAIMANNEVAVENTEGDRRNGKDRARQNLEEGEPKMRR